MHQSLQGSTFHVEHIVPESKGGPTKLDNLAWSSPNCNLRKSVRTVGVDPITKTLQPLFHPRLDNWSDHFRWDEFRIEGSTPIAAGDDCNARFEFLASACNPPR
jgi:hypothetical protein